MSGNESKKESKITKIDFDALKARIVTVLDNIKNEDIGIDQIEDKSYMNDMGGMEVFEAIKARNGQYDNTEMGVALKQHDEAFLTVKALREKEKIEEIRNNKKEKSKEIIVADLKRGQERRQNRIQEIDKEIGTLEGKVKYNSKMRDIFKGARDAAKIELKNHPSNNEEYKKDYKAANKETQKFMRRVREDNKKIAKLNDEKTGLQEEYDKLEELIAEVENDTLEMEKEGEQQIDSNDGPEGTPTSPAQPEQPAQPTPQPPQPGQPEQPAPQPPQPGQPEQPAPQPPQPEQPAQPTPQPPQPGQPAQPTPQPEQQTQGDPTQENTLRLEEIKFYIKEDGTPAYVARIFNGDKEIDSIEISGKNIEVLQEGDAKFLRNNHSIQEADKYYDRNIAKFSEIMKNITQEDYPSMNPDLIKEYNKLGYSLWDNYRNMLVDKEVKKDEIKEQPLKIDYDFSNLGNLKLNESSKEKINTIRKIAKNNAKKGLATYEKAPNIIKRLYDKIRSQLVDKTKLIGAPDEEQQNTPDGTTQEDNLFIDALLEQYMQEQPIEEQDIKNEIIKTYREMSGEEGFKIKKFIKFEASRLGKNADYVEQIISDWDKTVEVAEKNGIRAAEDKETTPFQAKKAEFQDGIHYDTSAPKEQTSEESTSEPAKTQDDKAQSPEQPADQPVASTDQEER